MIDNRKARALLATLVVATAISDVACAAAQRTFVATSGNDAHPCSLAAPCRTFAAAMAQTNANGEIVVLDAGGYGPVTITQSVSIIAPPGIYAGVSVFSGDGITINAGPSDRIVLRGLTINGQGGLVGIRVTQAREVHIEGCTIAYMNVDGISGSNQYLRVANTTSHTNVGRGIKFTGGTLLVDGSDVVRNVQDGVLVLDASQFIARNSRLDSNGGSGAALSYSGAVGSADALVTKTDLSDNSGQGMALVADPTTGPVLVHAAVDDVTVEHNSSVGIYLVGAAGSETVRGSINRAHVAFNGQGGVRLDAGAAGLLSISRSAITHNGQIGLRVQGTTAGIVELDGNTIVRNAFHDIDVVAPAVVRTAGNNTLTGDPPDILGTLTNNPQK